jgi:hypothetical protein
MNSYFAGSQNNANNLGIGHSMGGLALRDTDRLTSTGNKKFGGIITVCSPNYGAPIANSIISGTVEKAAEDACSKIVKGPVAEQFNLPWGIVQDLTTDKLGKFFITNSMVDHANGTGGPVTLNDLKEGSTAVTAINNYVTTTHRISIWSEENSPVHWRLFSSDTFGNDQFLVDKVKTARAVYNAHYVSNSALAASWALSIGAIPGAAIYAAFL